MWKFGESLSRGFVFWGMVGEVYTFQRVFLAWHGERGSLGCLKEEWLRSWPFKISSIFLKGKKEYLNSMQFMFKVILMQFCNPLGGGGEKGGGGVSPCKTNKL
jgi:hypothetical protein